MMVKRLKERHGITKTSLIRYAIAFPFAVIGVNVARWLIEQAIA